MPQDTPKKTVKLPGGITLDLPGPQYATNGGPMDNYQQCRLDWFAELSCAPIKRTNAPRSTNDVAGTRTVTETKKTMTEEKSNEVAGS